MGVHHVLHAVSDEVTAGQRIEHAGVAHRDPVVDGDGVELGAPATGGVDHFLHPLANFVQMDVPRHELGEAIDDGDDGLVEVRFAHAVGAPEGARACHVASVSRGATAISCHACTYRIFGLRRPPLLQDPTLRSSP